MRVNDRGPIMTSQANKIPNPIRRNQAERRVAWLLFVLFLGLAWLASLAGPASSP
jgi:hypothetical protein